MATRLFVGNLADSVTASVLYTLFKDVGRVESTNIVLDPATNRSRGFGFVEMSSHDELEEAIETYDGWLLEGRPISVERAR